MTQPSPILSEINFPSAGFAQLSFTADFNTVSYGSPYGGAEQVTDLVNDRWRASAEFACNTFTRAAALRAWVTAMHGQANTVTLYDRANPAPAGTLRGTLTLNAAAAAGATSILVTGGAGQAGKTLLQGDLLGVGGQLFVVSTDVTFDGAGLGTVLLANRPRVALSNGASVTWDKPTAEFRLASKPSVDFVPGYGRTVPVDFIEKI